MQGTPLFAEVKYFFRLAFGPEIHTLFVGSVFSPPDSDLLRSSFGVVYACHYQGDNNLEVFRACDIKSVVAMIPFFQVMEDGTIFTPETEHFLIEKPGLEIAQTLGMVEEDDYEDIDNDGT